MPRRPSLALSLASALLAVAAPACGEEEARPAKSTLASASAPPPAPPPAPPEPEPEPEPETVPQEEAPKPRPPVSLPDGIWSGALDSSAVEGKVDLVVRGGRVVSASLSTGSVVLPLNARSFQGDGTVLLTASASGDYVHARGSLLGDEVLAGDIEGAIARKKVAGGWYAVRR